MVLLKEEHVTRLLLIDVSAQDAQSGLVKAPAERRDRPCRGGGPSAAASASSMKRDTSSSTRWTVSLSSRALGSVHGRSSPGTSARPWIDESVIDLVKADLAHSALVKHRADRTQHFLVLLPGSPFVHAHGGQSRQPLVR